MTSGERRGLSGIQQRLAHAGARMTLASKPGAGTRIEIVAPWIPAAPKSAMIANLVQGWSLIYLALDNRSPSYIGFH